MRCTISILSRLQTIHPKNFAKIFSAAQTAGLPSALRGHQPAGDRRLSLRPSVLRTRGHDEEPPQGSAVGPLCRSGVCHRFGANPFRQLLSALAYTLIEGLRRLALEGTVLATTGPNRIRLTLLRTGAVVVRHTRRIRLLLSSTCPHQEELFHTVAASPGHLLTIAEGCPGTLTN